MMTGWTGLKHLATGGKGGPLGAKVLARWTPAMLGRQAQYVLGRVGVPIAALIEGLGGGFGALADPEYQEGKIGYLRSLGRELSRRGDVAQAKTREKLDRGVVSGSLLSALSGITNPISTVTGLGQALVRAAKAPFSSKKAGVLGPIVKRATAELGGDGTTLDELVKAAIDYQTQPPKLPPHLAKELGVEPQVSFGDRFRSLITGIKPEELKTLRSGASALSGIMSKLQSLGLMQAS